MIELLHGVLLLPNERKAGEEREMKQLGDFDAFNEVNVAASGVKVYDSAWVEEHRGGLVRSRLAVRQFKIEGRKDDTFAATPDALLKV